MKIIEGLIQGSPAWHAHRAQHFNASDAPAMMGCSPYKTRADLIREVATGISAEVSPQTQRLFDDGHRTEALARPIAEKIIGEELYPVTATNGALSASLDGLTMAERFSFECKRLNKRLRDAMFAGCTGADLPMDYRVQMEHQHAVADPCEKTLFVAAEFDDAGNLVEERHCWYTPDPELRAQILAGWAQFEKDVAAYVPTEAAEPAAVGRAPDALPALRIEVTGAVTASNLAEFKATALHAIRSVNRDLKTDADFADADKAVKWCADVESRLKAAKEHALSQTADIDALFKTLDDIGAEARTVRLDLDKLVKRRKDEVKEEAVIAARRALAQHVASLDAELAPVRLTPPAVDFALAIKGLRSIASMQDALDTELANGKIAADAQARVIRANRKAMDEADAAGLFPDFQHVCTKPTDDFANLIANRRAQAQARLDAERERIRAEEAARLEREAAAKRAEEERLQREADARAERERLAALNTPEQGTQQVLKAEASTPDATDRDAPAHASPVGGPMGAGQPAAAAPAQQAPVTMRQAIESGKTRSELRAGITSDAERAAPAAIWYSPALGDFVVTDPGESGFVRYAQAEPVAWRDHVEQRIREWRQRTMNRSGDHLAIDDFMDAESIDDLVDYVCDEWAGPPPQPPAQETE